MIRAHLNIFGPWVLWPLASYSRREHETSPQAPEIIIVERFTLSLLFLSIEISRRETRPRTVAR